MRRYAIRLLFVCTAGRCRSPVAAALLEMRLGNLDSGLSVRSVGLKVTGEPTPEIGISRLAERGIDLDPHRSTPVTADELIEADVILGMTREHVREIVGASPEAWPKTFTLKDFVRRIERTEPRRRRQRVSDWLATVGAGRNPRDVLGSHPDDDVHDPFGQRAKAWERVIDELDDLVSEIPRALGVFRTTAPQVTRAQRGPEGVSSHQQRRANVAR